MYYKDKTKNIDLDSYLNQINDKCLIIYSKTSVEINNINLNRNNFDIYSTKDITIDKNKIDYIFNDISKYDRIITVGGGTATDIGKYLSSKYNKKLICVPTMLSTNAYSTNKVALKIDNDIQSIDAILPTEILFDIDMVKKSKENNLYGIVDILSISTALNDWSLDIKYNNVKKTKEYDEALDLLEVTINYIKNEKVSKIQNNVLKLYKLVGESGYITNKFGSGKPESGSEHIFAKVLEKKINIPHAIAVANGILLMSLSQLLYEDLKINEDVYTVLNKINVYELNKKYNIEYKMIEDVFLELKPREDRFSIINIIYKNNEKKKKVLIEYKKILNLG